MRQFSSYGPIDKSQNYYVPRKELIATACTALMGSTSSTSGHYITVWAPRQRGKTWMLQEA
ncbi:MAG: hypothetical protein GY757_46015, partial [bacterium]|nr:hypothetical protein [bacterium]